MAPPSLTKSGKKMKLTHNNKKPSKKAVKARNNGTKAKPKKMPMTGAERLRKHKENYVGPYGVGVDGYNAERRAKRNEAQAEGRRINLSVTLPWQGASRSQINKARLQLGNGLVKLGAGISANQKLSTAAMAEVSVSQNEAAKAQSAAQCEVLKETFMAQNGMLKDTAQAQCEMFANNNASYGEMMSDAMNTVNAVNSSLEEPSLEDDEYMSEGQYEEEGDYSEEEGEVEEEPRWEPPPRKQWVSPNGLQLALKLPCPIVPHWTSEEEEEATDSMDGGVVRTATSHRDWKDEVSCDLEDKLWVFHKKSPGERKETKSKGLGTTLGWVKHRLPGKIVNAIERINDERIALSHPQYDKAGGISMRLLQDTEQLMEDQEMASRYLVWANKEGTFLRMLLVSEDGELQATKEELAQEKEEKQILREEVDRLHRKYGY